MIQCVRLSKGLINVEKLDASYDAGDLHRSKDPGVGAFSPYFNSSTVSRG